MAPSPPSFGLISGLATVLGGFISTPSTQFSHYYNHKRNQCKKQHCFNISPKNSLLLTSSQYQHDAMPRIFYTHTGSHNQNVARMNTPSSKTAMMMSSSSSSSRKSTTTTTTNTKNFLVDDPTDLFDEVYENEKGGTIVESPVMFANEDSTKENFDFIRWERHRSPVRYTRLLIGTFVGVTTKRIFPIVMMLAGLSAAIDAIYEYDGLPNVALPLVPFELTAPVLGLLLVFRSNTAYERFNLGSDASWEITVRFRSLIRQLISWTANKKRFTMEERMAAYDLVDACVLMHWIIMHDYLRPGHVESPQERDKLFRKALALEYDDGNDQNTEIQEMIMGGSSSGGGNNNNDNDALSSNRLTPSGGITAISIGIATRLPSLDTQETTQIDEQFCEIMSSLGTCEKLLRTPIPLGYTRYSVRFLLVWLTLLPLALVNKFAEFGERPVVLVLAMVITSFSFLSIEEISVQIEEPFCILPLELHHKWLLRDVKQIERMNRVVDKIYLKREKKKEEGISNVGSQHEEEERAINGDSVDGPNKDIDTGKQ